MSEKVIDAKKFHLETIDMAKESLLQFGGLLPMAFIVAKKGDVPKRMVETLRSVDGTEINSVDDDFDICMGMEMNMPPKLALEIAQRLGGKEVANALELLHSVGSKQGIKNVEEHLLQGFLSASKLDIKDLQAFLIVDQIIKTNAHSIIKLDEGWFFSESVPKDADGKPVASYVDFRKSIPASLDEDPRSIECITSICETRTETTAISVPILRNAIETDIKSGPEFAKLRTSTPIIGFGEPRIEVWKKDGTVAVSGRFLGFLEKADAARAEARNPGSVVASRGPKVLH